MTEARPPGWYDDPGGNHASLRWWNGAAWTSVTRQRAPSESLPDPDLGPGSELLVSGSVLSRRFRWGWTVGGLVAALLVVVFATGLVGGDGRDGLAQQVPGTGPATVLPSVLPSEPAPTTPRPVTGRFTDRVARLSYDVLPGDWREWDRDSFRGLLSTLGYYRVTQEDAPNQQTYWANVNSGPVAPDVAAGTGLAATARRLTDTLAGQYYPRHSRDGFSQRELTVDGARASLIRYRAVFDPRAAAGYSAKSEQVVVLVLDTGQPVPSALYVSLPDTVRDLWPSIEGLLGSVRVLR